MIIATNERAELLHTNLSVNEKGHLCFAGMDTVELAEKHGYDLLGKIPMDPKLSALVDKGWIEMMDNDYLEKAAEILVNRTQKKM